MAKNNDVYKVECNSNSVTNSLSINRTGAICSAEEIRLAIVKACIKYGHLIEEKGHHEAWLNCYSNFTTEIAKLADKKFDIDKIGIFASTMALHVKITLLDPQFKTAEVMCLQDWAELPLPNIYLMKSRCNENSKHSSVCHYAPLVRKIGPLLEEGDMYSKVQFKNILNVPQSDLTAVLTALNDENYGQTQVKC